MNKQKRVWRPSHATVIAYLALFVALGGSAYAFHLGKNSVGTKQLRKNAVTGAKVKDNSLTGNDINEATLDTVPSAAQARNAQTLGGMSATQLIDASKLRCPSGTTLSVGVCMETTTQQGELGTAEVTCADRGRRLPTEGELIVYQIDTFSKPDNIPPAEWIEPQYISDTSLFINTVANDVIAVGPPGSEEEFIAVSTDEKTAVQAFRCVTLPTN